MTDVRVVPVESRRDLKAFIDLPKAIFARDPQWVAPLDVERRMHLGKHNPYFEHAEAQLFLATRGDRPVGRISAQVDRLHLERYGDGTGQFGFLDAVDDASVFATLLGTAETWLRSKGIGRVQGPFSFSINDESGLLVRGFDKPPAIMMGHALPYYGAHVEAAGYSKAKDLIAYEYDLHNAVPRGLSSVAAKAQASGRLKVRPLSKRNLERDLDIIIDIFNDAWSTNWNFVPMTPAEIKNLGSVLKLLVDERHVAIASLNEEPAAMIVSLPDLNGMTGDLDGRLLPFGWAKFLWRLKAKTHPAFRVALMGVRSRYRSSAVGAMLAIAVIDAIHLFHRSRGTLRSELSWILEDNMPMRRIIEALGADPYKTYRIYEKTLA